MSIFKFREKNESGILGDIPKIYFLNESNEIVPEEKSKKFAVRKKLEYGFREFFGVINNPKHITVENADSPIPNLPFLSEDTEDYYTLYEMDKDVIISIDNKKIPLYITKDFIDLSPDTFAGVKRTKDEISKSAIRRRRKVYDKYMMLNRIHLKSLSEVNCNSVAYLYEYLNDGEKWKVGMEYYGYVDGLWETGSYLTVAIDTFSWDEHTAVHELGHSVSYFLNNNLFNEWYNISSNKNEMPPSEYAKTEISEDFAESYAYYFMNGTQRQHLKTKCPIRYKYMNNLEKQGNSALLSNLQANKELSKRFSLMDKVIW